VEGVDDEYNAWTKQHNKLNTEEKTTVTLIFILIFLSINLGKRFEVVRFWF